MIIVRGRDPPLPGEAWYYSNSLINQSQYHVDELISVRQRRLLGATNARQRN